MAKAIVSSMNKSFEELIKALKELAAANGGGGGGGKGGGGGGTNPIPANETPEQKKAREAKEKGSGGDAGKAEDDKAASKAGAQKVYVVNAPAGWK